MKRFVIFDPTDGYVKVTDSEKIAAQFALVADCVVFDNEQGMELIDGLYYLPKDLDEPNLDDDESELLVEPDSLSDLDDSDEE